MKNTIYLTLNYTKVKNIMISSFKSFFLKKGFCVEKRNRFCCCCRGGGLLLSCRVLGWTGLPILRGHGHMIPVCPGRY